LAIDEKNLQKVIDDLIAKRDNLGRKGNQMSKCIEVLVSLKLIEQRVTSEDPDIKTITKLVPPIDNELNKPMSNARRQEIHDTAITDATNLLK